MLPSLASQQISNVQKRYICETGRLISDILEISDKLIIDSYLVTVDIKKTFDSLDHVFFLVVLKNVVFGNNFIDWIRILSTNNEFCVINGRSTASYLQLKKKHIKVTQFLPIYSSLL